jgi:hypothetical protein
VEPLLEVTDADARISGRERTGRGEALGEIRHSGYRLQRILRRDQPPDPIQAEMPERLPADREMAFVGRVEGTSEQPDAAARHRAWRGGLAPRPVDPGDWPAGAHTGRI